ncbi:MAG: DinB family protein [Desulfovibrio sp.]|jgi:hypothetical protein|nr:DinB family protein [Desulfovibrio sp.]
MTLDPQIQYFKDDVERFWGMMEQQIEVCPDALWNKKAGGFVFWQQILHSVGCAEIYALEDPEPPLSVMSEYSTDVVMLNKEPDTKVSKTKLREVSDRVKKLVLTFLDGLTPQSISGQHERMTRRMGRLQTRQHAAQALIRHCGYHLGGCDAALREHGVKGVY